MHLLFIDIKSVTYVEANVNNAYNLIHKCLSFSRGKFAR